MAWWNLVTGKGQRSSIQCAKYRPWLSINPDGPTGGKVEKEHGLPAISDLFNMCLDFWLILLLDLPPFSESPMAKQHSSNNQIESRRAVQYVHPVILPPHKFSL